MQINISSVSFISVKNERANEIIPRFPFHCLTRIHAIISWLLYLVLQEFLCAVRRSLMQLEKWPLNSFPSSCSADNYRTVLIIPSSFKWTQLCSSIKKEKNNFIFWRVWWRSFEGRTNSWEKESTSERWKRWINNSIFISLAFERISRSYRLHNIGLCCKSQHEKNETLEIIFIKYSRVCFPPFKCCWLAQSGPGQTLKQ